MKVHKISEKPHENAKQYVLRVNNSLRTILFVYAVEQIVVKLTLNV